MQPKTNTAHRCYLCGNLVGGVPGKDYHAVTNRGQTRYYCIKCLEKELKNG